MSKQAGGHPHLLSIVTITKNNADGLKKTMASLKALPDQALFEWVIVYCHSTDGTEQVLEEAALTGARVSQESGKGIYTAMNDGIKMAAGSWILFLNAGDQLIGKELPLQELISQRSDMICGLALDESGQPLQYPGDWKGMPTSHQAIFYQSSIIKHHQFLTDFEIAADFEHWLRLKKYGFQHANVTNHIAIIEPRGISETRLFKRILETYIISSKHFKFGIREKIYYLKKVIWAARANLNTLGRGSK
jgi:putative colanic acid biosynthesis glycosyltransferase